MEKNSCHRRYFTDRAEIPRSEENCHTKPQRYSWKMYISVLRNYFLLTLHKKAVFEKCWKIKQ